MESLKILNLVMAIIYTIILSLIGLTAINEADGETLLGTVVLFGPVIVNWVNYAKLSKVREKRNEEVKYVDVELKK